MLTARVRGLGIALAILLLAAGMPRVRADEPKNDKVKELLKEKLAVLGEVAKLTDKEYRSERCSIDRLHHAQMAVLKARLELCETDKERIAVLEEAGALANDNEKTAAALYQAGEVPGPDALVAKAARLEAEIALERAKAKTPAKPK